MNKKLITLTGKVRIFAAGHKDAFGQQGYRDEAGDFHAEFFTASITSVDATSKHVDTYRWNVNANDAEELANAPMGTTFTVTLTAKMRKNDLGDEVEKTFPGADGNTTYHECNLVDIDVDKLGKLPRMHRVKYFADIKADDKNTDANVPGESEE